MPTKKFKFTNKITTLIILSFLIGIGTLITHLSIICSNNNFSIKKSQRLSSYIYLLYISSKIKKIPLVEPLADTEYYSYYPMDCIERYYSTVEYKTTQKGREIELFYDDYFVENGYKKLYSGGVPRFSRDTRSRLAYTFRVNIYEEDEKLDSRKVVITYIH